MTHEKKMIYLVYRRSANFPSAVFESQTLAQEYIQKLPAKNAQANFEIHEFEIKTTIELKTPAVFWGLTLA